MNTLNSEAIELIKSFEGLRTDAYQDSGGVWTIGYGHTSAAGPPAVKRGMTITPNEALGLLAADLNKNYVPAVVKALKVPVNDNQFGALVSFTYNLGAGSLNSSTLLKKVNAGDFEGAANEFAKWNKDDGMVLSGLTRRRAAEAALFRKAPSIAIVVNSVPQSKPEVVVVTASVKSTEPPVMTPTTAPKTSVFNSLLVAGSLIIAAIAAYFGL